jgi:hypothetical protein
MPLPRWLTILNAIGALIAAGFSIAGLIAPAMALPGGPPASALAALYAQVYAARAIPLAGATLLLLGRRAPRGLAPVLAVAGLAQLGDAISGAANGVLRMVLGSALLAAIHLGSVWWLARATGAAQIHQP